MSVNLDKAFETLTIIPGNLPPNWECKEQEETRISHDADIITQIRTPVNTQVTLTFNDVPILTHDLAAGIPLTLNLPVFAIVWGPLDIHFQPETSYELQTLRIDNVAKAILWSADSIQVPRHNWQCKDGVIVVKRKERQIRFFPTSGKPEVDVTA